MMRTWLAWGTSSMLFFQAGTHELDGPSTAAQLSAPEEGSVPEGLTAGEWTSIREAHEVGRHAAYPVEGGYRARNPGQQWETHFDGRGFTTAPRAGGWTWGLELRSYGFSGAEREVESQARVRAEGSRVEYEWDGTLAEWYVNDRRGLEHGYTLRERPGAAARADGPLSFTLSVRGCLRAQVMEDERGAHFVNEGGAAVLTYAGLVVFDAAGRSLPARLERITGGLRLVVDERGASYPLTIDPTAQQAYLKASNTDAVDAFGAAVSISGDTVVIGAPREDSNATGVNGDQSDNSVNDSGAAYVFVRSGASWTQQAYLKASNPGAVDMFGLSVSISGDTAVIGADLEDSNATGVNGDQSNNGALNSGAAYVFVRNGTTWSQQAYLKASNTGSTDKFGYSVSISADTVIVGADGEASNATGVNGNQSNNSVNAAGAGYVFVRSGTTWAQQAYLKASNTDAFDLFGGAVSISGDTVAVGAIWEDSNASGVNGNESDDSADDSGAAYVFVRNGTTWTQQAYFKASNVEALDIFGISVAISNETVVVGARDEDSSATGVNGDQGDDGASDSGAAYVFVRNGTTWTQQAYLKASNTGADDFFGYSVCISGDTVLVGASLEASNATGVNGNQNDNSAFASGAAYVFVRSGTNWTQQAYLKGFNSESGDFFGDSVSVSGNTAVVGASGEDSVDTGVNGDQSNNDAETSGASYVYLLSTEWTGATDSDWTDASNWTLGVPDSSLIAIIPDAATTANDPVISVSGQTCGSLWIQSGGTLDISAGMDSLGVFVAAVVEGPITGAGQLVFETDGTLTGSSTIGLSFSPAVRADAHLELLGGPLTITGDFLGNASVSVAPLATFDIGGSVTVAGDLSIDGSLSVGNGLDVGATLSSSSSGQLEVMGTGACVVAGELCFHGDVTTSCSLSIERSTPDVTDFEADDGWPADVTIDIAGSVNLLTADLQIGGDLLLQNGTVVLGVDSKITTSGANGIRIADADALDPIALLDVGARVLQVPAAEGVTIGNRGKLNIGEGGTLELAGTLTVESGGTLCLDGVPADPASLTGYLANRYALTLDPGSTLAAKGFVFSGMTSSGIVIGPSVSLAAAPYDLRAGVFDDPAPGGVLLDIERSLATQLRYLRFDNSFSAAGVSNVKTTLASMPITLVNWSGDLAPDASTAEMFDIDPGESSPPERIVWAPPEESDVQGFTASWGPSYVMTTWQTVSEIDSQSFLVRRSPEPPGTFVDVGEMPSVGASSYELLDYAFTAFAGSRYRLYERLTHGELRLIGEVMLPASGIVPRSGGSTPAPPMPPSLPLVVGPGGRYPDVHTALTELSRSRQSAPVTLELARGTHAPFEIGRELAFDLCLVARTGAVIDASHAPLRIAELSSKRSLELVDLVVDARRGLHPAVVVEHAQGVVLFQDVRVRGNTSAPAMRLSKSTAVALQGGAIEGVLELASRSRATASGVALAAIELRGCSMLETRGMDLDPALETGSRWLACEQAPRLAVEDGHATITASAASAAWLLSAQGLGFHGVAGIEGVNLLDPQSSRLVGRALTLASGEAGWSLGTLPPGETLYLQVLTLDGASRRVSLSDVVRVESGR